MVNDYIEKSLGNDEKIILNLSLTPVLKKFCIVFAVAAIWLGFHAFTNFINFRHWHFEQKIMPFFSFAVFLTFLTISIFFQIISTEMAVTNKRVISKSGYFYIIANELKNEKIESVEINQSLLGRFFDYGTIILSGVGTSKVIFYSVSAPFEMKKEIEKIIQ